VRQFEIVEADRRDRRRGDEYRAAVGKPEEFDFYDPGEEGTVALEEISRVIRQKALKHYSPKPNLLIFVNLSEGEPTSLFAYQVSAQFGHAFESAWLLWQSQTIRLWPNAA